MSSLTKKILIGLVVAVVLMLFVIGTTVVGTAVFGWKAALRAGNEVAAQQNLKTITVAEIQYFNTHQRTFGSIDQLVREQFLSAKFAGSPAIDGYIFTLRITAKTAGQPNSYTLNADPQSSSTGSKHFYSDSTSSIIHVNANGPAGPNDPSVRD